jgi:hypothetical protein
VIRRSPPERTARTAAAIDVQSYASHHYVVIRVQKIREKKSLDFENLTAETRFVHVDGHIFYWLLKEILKRAPNLKTLQTIPSGVEQAGERHRALLREHKVEFVAGYHKPEMAWEEGRTLSTYRAQQKFMRGLAGDQAALFAELLAMDFESAKMISRYFCLSGEEYVPMRVIAEEWGYSHNTHVSCWMNAILRYLDPEFETGEESQRHARNVVLRVARLRPLLDSAKARDEALQALGLDSLPEGFPWSRFDEFAEVVQAQRDGRLAALETSDTRAHQALVLRFGLGAERVYRTLLVVGEAMGVSRERIRQLEERALEMLSESQRGMANG